MTIIKIKNRKIELQKGDKNKMNLNYMNFNRRPIRLIEIENKNYISLSDLNLKNRPDKNLITAISILSESGYLPLEIIPLENAINLTENTRLKEFLELIQ